MNRLLEIEMLGQRSQVIGVVIHVVAVGGLGGAAVTPPVVGDVMACFQPNVNTNACTPGSINSISNIRSAMAPVCLTS